MSMDKKEATPTFAAGSWTEAPKQLSQDEVFEWIRPVEDPDVFISLVDLGLIYTAKHEGSHVALTMTLTSPMCPSAPQMMHDLDVRLREHPQVESSTIEIVWEPRWDPAIHASEEVKERLGIW